MLNSPLSHIWPKIFFEKCLPIIEGLAYFMPGFIYLKPSLISITFFYLKIVGGKSNLK